MWLDSSTVRPARRLVEQQQLDVGRQPGDERDLLPVALGIGAALLGRVQVEALEQLGAPVLVEPPAQAAEEVDRLAAGEVRPQAHVTRDVGQATVQRDRVRPRVAAQKTRKAGVGAEESEQHADRRRLPRAVGAEEAVHLALGNVEVEAVERPHAPEGLDETGGRDCIRHVSETAEPHPALGGAQGPLGV
jgi:hypothetical protein